MYLLCAFESASIVIGHQGDESNDHELEVTIEYLASIYIHVLVVPGRTSSSLLVL